MEPTYLEKCVLLMESNAGVSLAYSWLRVTGAEERVWKSESLDLDRMRYYNHVSISAVFRREAGLEGGGFCAAMREGYEDWEFWLRLGACGYRGEVIPEMLVNYRRHEASFMNRARKRHAELFDDIYRRNPAVFEDADARRAVRHGYRDRPVRNPFVNLDDPDQYGHALPMVVLVLSGDADRDTAGRLVKLLRNDPALCVVQTGAQSSATGDSLGDEGGTADYTLSHFLPTGLHGEFIAHLVRTRPVRAVLWHDPGPAPAGLAPVGLAEVSGLDFDRSPAGRGHPARRACPGRTGPPPDRPARRQPERSRASGQGTASRTGPLTRCTKTKRLKTNPSGRIHSHNFRRAE